MLKKILKGSDCASCRICCVFDRYDLWETPLIDEKLYEKIRSEFPETEFVSKGDARLMKMSEDADGLYYCPMLDRSSGCRLGDEKPFDCRIWPYRIMELGGKQVISIASICPSMFNKPLSELTGFLDESGLAEEIFRYADSFPEAVKPYEAGYPILKVRE